MSGFTEKTLKAIETARTKSERARHTIALIIAGTFTFVLFLIWAFILLPFRFNSVTADNEQESNSPFQALKAQVGGAYDDFMKTAGGQIQKLKGSDTGSLQVEYQKIKSQAQTEQPIQNN